MTKEELKIHQQQIRLELIALFRNDFSSLPLSSCLKRIKFVEKYVSEGTIIEETENA